jgi:hypothetical protein
VTARLRIESRRALARFANVGPAALARTLWRAATVRPPAELRAPARAERIVVSLTTTPARARNLSRVLAGLLDQSVPPDRVVLALPRRTRAGVAYPDRAELRLPPTVDVLPCEDEGPATKLLPALALEPDALIVVVDDDVVYPRGFIEALLAEHRRRPAAALGFRGVRLQPGLSFAELDHFFATGIPGARPVDVLFGTWGYMLPPGALGPQVRDFSGAPEALRWVDDIWVSGHLARAGVERWVVSSRELPVETSNIWRSALTSGVNASGENDRAGLEYFAADW